MCVNSASTVLGGAGNNSNDTEHKTLARSSRVRQGVSKRHVVGGTYRYWRNRSTRQKAPQKLYGFVSRQKYRCSQSFRKVQAIHFKYNLRAPLKIAFLRVSCVSVVLESSFIPHKLRFLSAPFPCYLIKNSSNYSANFQTIIYVA